MTKPISAAISSWMRSISALENSKISPHDLQIKWSWG